MGGLTFYIVGMGQRLQKRFARSTLLVTDRIEDAESYHGRVVLSLVESPRKKSGIAKEAGVGGDELNLCLKELVAAKLVFEDSGVYANALPVFTEEAMLNVFEQTESIAAEEAKVVKPYIEGLAAKWEDLGYTPEWSRASHFIVDMFVLDVLFLRAVKNIEKKEGLWSNRTKGQRLLPAFFLEHNGGHVNFKVDTYMPQNLAVLSGSLFKREGEIIDLLLNDEVWRSLRKVESAEDPVDVGDDAKKLLLKYGWIEKRKGDYRLAVPVIQFERLEPLLSDMAEAATSAAETVVKQYPQILQLYKKSPYSRYLEAPGDYLDYLYHVLTLRTIQNLVKSSSLPGIPEPAPWNFGVYFLRGKTRKLLKIFFKAYREVANLVGEETEWGKTSVSDGIIFYLTSKLLGA